MTTIDETTGEITDTTTATALAVAPDTTGSDLASAPLNWNALVRIADTDFVPRALRGNPSAVLACVFTGREVGLDAMASLRLVDIIDGRPSLSAELTVALIRAAGHGISLIDETPDSCTVEGTRYEDPADTMTITYTLEDARHAGLVTLDDDGRPRSRSRSGKALPWETYTSDLLWARAVSRLARRLFPDVTAAPSRSAVAAFETAPTDNDSATHLQTVTTATFTLGKLLEDADSYTTTAVDAEVFLRKTCRLAVTAEMLDTSPLPAILEQRGARHVTDLSAAEVRDAASEARRIVGAAYATATGRDIINSAEAAQ